MQASTQPRKTRRSRSPRMSREQMSTQALQSALAERSMANYETIFAGFIEKGIAADDIKPRENVFTYRAWQALGRQVRKGESGVQIVTWIERKGGAGGEADQAEQGGDGATAARGRFPRSVTVFHVSQTDPVEAKH